MEISVRPAYVNQNNLPGEYVSAFIFRFYFDLLFFHRVTDEFRRDRTDSSRGKMFPAIASAARGLKREKDVTREIYGVVCLDSPNIQVSSRENDIHFAFDTGTSAPSSICSTVETDRLNNLPSAVPPTRRKNNSFVARIV